jgi:hypothetical protein
VDKSVDAAGKGRHQARRSALPDGLTPISSRKNYQPNHAFENMVWGVFM